MGKAIDRAVLVVAELRAQGSWKSRNTEEEKYLTWKRTDVVLACVV